MYVVTPKEMAKLDRITINEVGIPGIVLMENAGRGAFDFFLKVLPDLLERRIGVVCGSGNNGGDGFVIARLCHQKGADVRVFCAKDPWQLTGDAMTNFEVISNLNIPVYILKDDDSDFWENLRECTAVVDAIFGTGLSREVTGAFERLIKEINRMNVPVLSVDIPSGIDGSTGRVMGVAVQALATATFGLPKIGHYVWPGSMHTGMLEVIDIGIPNEIVEQASLNRFILTEQLVSRWIEPRQPVAHKGQAGHMVILAGSPGKTGAAAMAANSAVRSGAGLITLMVPESLNPILEEKTTESMTYPLKETLEHTISLEAEEEILSFLKDKESFAIGPGLSQNGETRELVRRLVTLVECPMVIDADGLNAIAGYTEEVLKNSKAPIVLTPHPGEMSRLVNMSVADVQINRLGVAQSFSRKYGVVVVLKGYKTIIAAPDGRVAINKTGNPAMASGGMGDILTGLIGAFLAQGIGAFEAACLGVYVHGFAADIIIKRRKWGTRGLAATDILETIPEVIAILEGL